MFEFRFVKKATFVSEICIVEIASTIEAHDIVLESRDEQLSSRLSSGAQLHARQGGRGVPAKEGFVVVVVLLLSSFVVFSS